MGFIPHPDIPLGSFRSTDMLILLVGGALFEILSRVVVWKHKSKPHSVKVREWKLKELERRVKKSRDLGPQAFVETSKLERQQLAEEKALANAAEQRKTKLAYYESILKRVGLGISAIIFITYYGIPILEFSADRVMPKSSALGGGGGDIILTTEEALLHAESSMKAFIFPLSVIGIGIRVSKLGLPNPKSSIGALLVFWSAQTTIGKIADGIEALCY